MTFKEFCRCRSIKDSRSSIAIWRPGLFGWMQKQGRITAPLFSDCKRNPSTTAVVFKTINP